MARPGYYGDFESLTFPKTGKEIVDRATALRERVTAKIKEREQRIRDAAKEMGLKKVLVTHAEFPSQSLTGDEQKELADLGAIIEHCFTTTYTNKAPWETAFANIRRSGVAKTVISTDLGQTINPPVAEGFAMFVQKLLDAGFTSDEIRTMAVTNPTRLIEE